jgi:hypothetical protein
LSEVIVVSFLQPKGTELSSVKIVAIVPLGKDRVVDDGKLAIYA